MIVWVDLETTGLVPMTNTILEIAVIVTGDRLETIDSWQSIVLPVAPDAVIQGLEEVVYAMHMANGLIPEILEAHMRKDALSLQTVEANLISWLKPLVGESKPRLGGSTVNFDRGFLELYMPRFMELLHYRNLDVTSLQGFTELWRPDIPQKPKNPSKRHRALDDLHDTLAEAQHYMEKVFG